MKSKEEAAASNTADAQPRPPMALHVSLRRRDCEAPGCACGAGYVEMALIDHGERTLALVALDKVTARWLSEVLGVYAGKPEGEMLQ